MKKIYLISLLLCAFTKVGAQKTTANEGKKFSLQIDTIRLNKANYRDSTSIRDYLDFIFDNFKSDMGNSLSILDFLYNRASDINNTALKGSTFNIKASIYALRSDFEPAVKNYIQAIKLLEQTGNQYSLAMMHNNIGMMYNNQGNKNAYTYFIKGIEIATKAKEPKPICLIYANLSKYYINNNQLELALQAAFKSDSLSDKLNMLGNKAINLNIIGAIYFYKNNFEKALEYYEKSRLLSIKIDDKHAEHEATVNIGEVYMLQNKSEALVYFNKAYAYFNSIKDLSNLQVTAGFLAEYYKKNKKFEEALLYAEKAHNAEKKFLDSINVKTIGKIQIQFETEKKEQQINLLNKSDSIKSLQIVKQQLDLSKNLYQITQQKLSLAGASLQLSEDSLMLSTQTQTILQNRLDSTQKEERIGNLNKAALIKQLEIDNNKLELNKKNTTIAIIGILAALVVFVGYAFYRRNQLKQQAMLATEKAQQREQITKAVIDAEENERKRIASDLHDGVGQMFSAVKMNLTGLIDRIDLPRDEDKFLAEKTLALVAESCKEVRVISHKMMPNFLLKSGIAADIRSFIEKIDEQSLKISFETEGFTDQLEYNEEVILYRVIQELVNNVIKHAMASSLKIVLKKDASTISVQVNDNGVGFDHGKLKNASGLGLKNIEVRVQYLKGTIRFENAKPNGTNVFIQIPIV